MTAPLTPNLYTHGDGDARFGLHRFRDGDVVVLKLHRCGDWQTYRPATKADVEGFERYGVKIPRREGVKV